MGQLEYIADRYGDGECGPFASALHELTGLPLVTFNLRFPDGYLPAGFPRHAAVTLGNGEFLDANGKGTLAQISERLQCILSVVENPQPHGYPFEASPQSAEFNAEEYATVLEHAWELVVLKDLENLLLPKPWAPKRGF